MSRPEFDPDRISADLTAIAERALKRAKKAGATQAEAAASQDRGLSVTARLGEVETVEHHQDRGLSVTVYFGRRKGSAASGDLSETSVEQVVERACDIARHTQDDPCAGLADAELMAADFPALDLWHPWELEADEAIVLAKNCEAAARADQRITNSEGAGVDSGSGVIAYANSHGFTGVQSGTRHGISCAVIAGSGDGMQVDHWYTVARRHEDLESAESVGKRAGERAIKRLNARQMKTEKVPVLFAPDMARSLIGHFIGAIRGSNLYRDASFLLDKRGEQVFAAHINIEEQPWLPRALGSAAFDSEGVATRERSLVRDGILQDYVLDSYAARKLGLQSTGNAGGVHNVTVKAGGHDFNQLLSDMRRGLIVTEMMGQGVNLVTGDYSRGAAGFWVEDGEIAWPVQEITVAGNLAAMFQGIVAVGNDLDERANIRTGSLLVEQMTIAGE